MLFIFNNPLSFTHGKAPLFSFELGCFFYKNMRKYKSVTLNVVKGLFIEILRFAQNDTKFYYSAVYSLTRSGI